jgi:hypothetical protein
MQVSEGPQQPTETHQPTQALAQAKVHRYFFPFSIVFVYQLNVGPIENSQQSPATANAAHNN